MADHHFSPEHFVPLITLNLDLASSTPDKTNGPARYELAANTIGDAAIEAAVEVPRSGRLIIGHRGREFEEAFAEWTGARHALMVKSGSPAILLACEASGEHPEAA